ncbi:sensor histidine kinase [Kribbella sandramycini]|uniref:Oxygen sensor histidine kinase NreB n=1 Tax=Kribbella sandramycini TaxID=60450 RepID=A0A7Y4KVZ9_9ACTN|nr:sensor histidine kinase [Kribbella sandramycini]MBB6567649.1 signal transduction histidine kinase [Kribbella sandramycini]NOL39750.1 sensor histidine kinase [Kribbella sandramycini]
MSRNTVSRLEFGVHLAFFLIVAGTFGRLLSLNSPLCVRVLTLSLLLCGGYAVTAWAGSWIGRGQVPLIAATTVVWTVLINVVPGPLAAVYSWLAIPLACVLLRVLPVRAAIVAIGIVTALLVSTLYRLNGDFEQFVLPAVATWATVALYARQHSDLAIRQDLLDQLQATRGELADRQHEAGVLAERARLAREIHDTITQELAGSRMLLQAADRDWDDDPAKARQYLQAVSETLGRNVTEARRLIADLTPPELDDGGLEAALEELCRRERQYGPAVELITTGARRPLSPDAETALLRTAQGALANVRDHAGADRIEVVLDWLDESLRLKITDNGAGVSGRAHAPDRGFGLPSLQQRLRALGGTLTVDSTPGHGTALTASLPAVAP